MKRKWRKGPPPSIGWWPASIEKNPESIRWWNGKCWSWSAWPHFTKTEAAWWAKHPCKDEHLIQWTDRWWQ